MRILRVLKSKKGEAFIWTAFLMLFISLLLAVSLELGNLYATSKGVRSSAQAVLDSYVHDTALDIFSSVRQASDYNDAVYQAKMRELLLDELGVTKSGSRYIMHSKDGKELFWLSSPVISFSVDNSVKLEVDFTLVVPVFSFGFAPQEVDMRLKSEYVLKV